jgi:hypothetical protein
MLLLIVALLASPGQAVELRTEATRQFRAGNYAAACESFERAAALAPDDGAVAADVGLCLSKLGRKDDAIRWSMRAVMLGDAQTRRNAYFNLGTLGAGPRLADDADCQVLETVSGCSERVVGCRFGWYDGRRQIEDHSGSGVVLWRVPESEPMPPKDKTMVMSSTLGHPLDDETGLPKKEFRAAEVTPAGSIRLVVDETFAVSDTSWKYPDDPALQEKINASARKANAKMPPPLHCAIVAIDSCRGRIGLVCNGGTERRRWAEEVAFPPATSARRPPG